MRVDILRLEKNLASAKAEPTVPLAMVNPYLLESVVRPLQRGARLCYGNVDYSKFDIDELRVAAQYTEQCADMSVRLEKLVGQVMDARSAACKTRAFC